MMYRIVFLLVCFCVIEFNCVSPEKSFVLPKQHKVKKLSKNELKENIGQSAKDAFGVTTTVSQLLGSIQIEMACVEEKGFQKEADCSLNDVCPVTIPLFREIGQIQIELSSIQKKFSKVVEQLVDNQKPFKKASRDDLESALQSLQTVSERLHQHESSCQSLKNRLAAVTNNKIKERVTILADMQASFKVCVEEMKKLQLQMNKTNCLKCS